MNVKHVTNYKPKDFSELLNVSVKLFKYGTERDEEIAKSLQN